MSTHIDTGWFKHKRYDKPEIDLDDREAFPNRYRFSSGQKVKLTKEAIKEKIYEDYVTIEELTGHLYMYVNRVNNYPDGRGHTGQWVKTNLIDDWIDAHWFESFKEPEGVGPLSDVRSVEEAYRRMQREQITRGLY